MPTSEDLINVTDRLEVRIYSRTTGVTYVVRWPSGEKERARREVEGLLAWYRQFTLISHEGF